MMRGAIVAALAALLAACGQQQGGGEPGVSFSAPNAETAEPTATPLPPVDADLLAAPNSAFVAIEPTEIGVIGAPDIREALGPLVSAEALGEGESVQLSVQENGDTAIADIVRSGMADDAISSAHVRIEFRREEDGWYPSNAYRRQECRRGASAGPWTTAPCP